jgi:hypothetical protein
MAMAAIRRNIEGHTIKDQIHCTSSKLDEIMVEIFFSHLSLCKKKYNNCMIFARLGDKKHPPRSRFINVKYFLQWLIGFIRKHENASIRTQNWM